MAPSATCDRRPGCLALISCVLVDMFLNAVCNCEVLDARFHTRRDISGSMDIDVSLTDLIVVDMDGDGDMDIVARETFAPTAFLYVMENLDGGHTWETHRISAPAAIRSIAVGDVDGDGRPDIVCGSSQLSVGGFFGNFLGWFKKKTNGRFQYKEISDLPCEHIAVGHVNNDTFLDIVATSPSTQTTGHQTGILYFAGKGGGDFEEHLLLPGSELLDHEVKSLKTAEFNSEGVLDVLVLYREGDEYDRLLLHRYLPATSEFAPSAEIFRGSADAETIAVAMSGLRADAASGAPWGVIVAGSTIRYVHDVSGNATEWESVTIVSEVGEGIYVADCELSDFDNDGDLDIAVLCLEYPPDPNIPIPPTSSSPGVNPTPTLVSTPPSLTPTWILPTPTLVSTPPPLTPTGILPTSTLVGIPPPSTLEMWTVTLAWYENLGVGCNFSAMRIISNNSQAISGSMSVGDVDSDGFDDVLLAVNGSAAWYRNDWGTLPPTPAPTPAPTPSATFGLGTPPPTSGMSTNATFALAAGISAGVLCLCLAVGRYAHAKPNRRKKRPGELLANAGSPTPPPESSAFTSGPPNPGERPTPGTKDSRVARSRRRTPTKARTSAQLRTQIGNPRRRSASVGELAYRPLDSDGRRPLDLEGRRPLDFHGRRLPPRGDADEDVGDPRPGARSTHGEYLAEPSDSFGHAAEDANITAYDTGFVGEDAGVGTEDDNIDGEDASLAFAVKDAGLGGEDANSAAEDASSAAEDANSAAEDAPFAAEDAPFDREDAGLARGYTALVSEELAPAGPEGYWSCERCAKDFATRAKLDRHMLTIHEKPIRCPKCRKRFASDEALKRHFRERHPRAKLPSSLRKPSARRKQSHLRCACSRRFPLEKELERHQLRCPVFKSKCGRDVMAERTTIAGAFADADHRATNQGGDDSAGQRARAPVSPSCGDVREGTDPRPLLLFEDTGPERGRTSRSQEGAEPGFSPPCEDTALERGYMSRSHEDTVPVGEGTSQCNEDAVPGVMSPARLPDNVLTQQRGGATVPKVQPGDRAPHLPPGTSAVDAPKDVLRSMPSRERNFSNSFRPKAPPAGRAPHRAPHLRTGTLPATNPKDVLQLMLDDESMSRNFRRQVDLLLLGYGAKRNRPTKLAAPFRENNGGHASPQIVSNPPPGVSVRAHSIQTEIRTEDPRGAYASAFEVRVPLPADPRFEVRTSPSADPMFEVRASPPADPGASQGGPAPKGASSTASGLPRATDPPAAAACAASTKAGESEASVRVQMPQEEGARSWFENV